MTFSSESGTLAHYGVMGMKWGVRKDGKPQGFQYGSGHSSGKQTTGGSTSGSSRVAKVKDTANKAADKVLTKATHLNAEERQRVKAAKEAQKKQNALRSTMTDAELDRAIQNLNKQKQLNQLTNEVISPGKGIADTLLSNTGKQVMSALVSAGVATALGYAVSKTSAKGEHTKQSVANTYLREVQRKV